MSTDDVAVLVFVVRTTHESLEIESPWCLTQRVARPYGDRERTRIYNQVQRYLHSLSLRNGFDYSILYWGSERGAQDYLAGLDEIPF